MKASPNTRTQVEADRPAHAAAAPTERRAPQRRRGAERRESGGNARRQGGLARANQAADHTGKSHAPLSCGTPTTRDATPHSGHNMVTAAANERIVAGMREGARGDQSIFLACVCCGNKAPVKLLMCKCTATTS